MKSRTPTRRTSGGPPGPAWSVRRLEQYDFIIYGTASALVFSKVFFPNVSPVAGLIASFATYAIGFLARPLGGLFFSHFGEKYGRKWVLVTTLFLMGARDLPDRLPTDL